MATGEVPELQRGSLLPFGASQCPAGARTHLSINVSPSPRQ